MASRLLFTSIPDFPVPVEIFRKTHQRVPCFRFTLPPTTCYSSNNSISSSRRGSLPPLNAVKEELIQSPSSNPTHDSKTSPSSSSKLVLVVGGSGGVGQLIVASLLNRNIKSRLLVRDPEKAVSLFGKQDEETLQVFKGDTRNLEDLDPSIFEGVTHVICCTGTTAFPSKRWDGDNTPERVDWEGVKNLISALPSSLKRIVLVSSVGVTKFSELPWRPGRLTDGPYTSYDLNTLLKATAGKRRAVVIGQGDKLVGEVSRLVVAEACIQALDIEFTLGKIYEINSVEGDGPDSDPQKWQELFKAAQAQ
uniref:NAD(P)-binding domain-containing protein n=1 Tax=Fagus sylvatica TaxID=28930 RepID=A0A2N9J8K8_FAGSY